MSSDAHAWSRASLVGHDEKDNNAVGHVKSQMDCDMISPFSEIHIYGNNMDGLPLKNGKNIVGITPEGINSDTTKSIHGATQDTTPSLQYKNGNDQHPEQSERITPISTKFTIMASGVLRDSASHKQEMRFSVENGDNGWHESPLDKEQDLAVPEDDGGSRISTDHGDEAQELHTQMDNNSFSIAHDSQELSSNTRVYGRLKSNRSKAILEVDGGGMEDSISNASNQGLTGRLDSQEVSFAWGHRTRSMGLKASTRVRRDQ